MLFLFTHGTTNKVGTAESIAAELLNYLHNLLLINDTAVGWLKYRLEFRCEIADGACVVLT